MNALDALTMVLMDRNQPYDAAMKVPAGLALELIQSRLDESLGHLEGDGARLARKAVQVELEFGSTAKMLEAMKEAAPDAEKR